VSPFKKTIQAAAVAVIAFLISSCPVHAGVDILVFDFSTDDNFPDPWADIALTDFTINLLNLSEAYCAMPRGQLRRMIQRVMPEANGKLFFENYDTLRQHIGASSFIEGALESRNGSFIFKGTYTNMDQGTVKDLSFTLKKYNLEEIQRNLAEKLEKATGRKLDYQRENVMGTSSPQAYSAFWQGMIQYEAGAADRGGNFFNKALEHDPDYVDPRIVKGRILLEKTDLNRAVSVFRKAVELEPGNPWVHFWLGFALYLLHSNPEAETELLKAIELYPENPEYLHQLGTLYKSSGRYAEAVRMFIRSTEIDPSISDAWYQLASIYSSMKNKKETLSYLEKAIKWGGDELRVKIKNDADFAWLKNSIRF